MKYLSSIEATSSKKVYDVVCKLEADINSAFDDSVDKKTWHDLLTNCFDISIDIISPRLHATSRNAASEIVNEF